MNLKGFQRSSKDDSRTFYSCLDEDSMVWKFQGCVGAFQRCFKKVSRVFQECF